MANEKNLVPYKKGQLSHEQAKKYGSKGGKASVEAKKAKKTMHELAVMINDLALKGQDAESLAELGIKEDELNNKTFFAYKVFQKAVGGKVGDKRIAADTKAMRIWLEMSDSAKAEQALLENERLKLENERLRKELNGGGIDYEDLTPLGEMLKVNNDEDGDD